MSFTRFIELKMSKSLSAYEFDALVESNMDESSSSSTQPQFSLTSLANRALTDSSSTTPDANAQQSVQPVDSVGSDDDDDDAPIDYTAVNRRTGKLLMSDQPLKKSFFVKREGGQKLFPIILSRDDGAEDYYERIGKIVKMKPKSYEVAYPVRKVGNKKKWVTITPLDPRSSLSPCTATLRRIPLWL